VDCTQPLIIHASSGKKSDGVHELYLALYVENFVYLSPNHDTEIAFENKLKILTTVDFMGQVSHFLGIKLTWHHTTNNNINVYLTQKAFKEHLVVSNGLLDDTSVCTLLRFGHPIDNIPP